MDTERNDNLVAQVAGLVLAQMIELFPDRAELQALEAQLRSVDFEQRLKQLAPNGRLVARGGNLVVEPEDDPVSQGGGGAGFEVRGEPFKYAVIALREWTPAGDLVAPDSAFFETPPNTLEPTWDVVRAV